MSKPTDVLIEGIAGSQAFGLATETSDVDTHGVYRAPLNSVLGLNGSKVVAETYTSHNPDIALHEVGKFIGLALKCNPTVLETLWLSEYTTLTYDGRLLIKAKQKFLYEKGVRNAYGGFAISQINKLTNGAKVTAKLGRHAMRLLWQGTQLLGTGDMKINVGEHRDYFFAMGELAVTNLEDFLFKFERAAAVMENTKSVLAERPERDYFSDLLPRIRLAGAGL